MSAGSHWEAMDDARMRARIKAAAALNGLTPAATEEAMAQFFEWYKAPADCDGQDIDVLIAAKVREVVGAIGQDWQPANRGFVVVR